MSWPSPAMRADWWSNNHESRLNLEGHAPTAHLYGGRWRPACATDACIDPDDPGVYDHHDPAAAVDQARDILTGRIHGPAAGQEHHA